jgi:predicted transcriptional regulator
MPVARVEYHVRVLEKAGAILRVRRGSMYGATTDLYKAT